MNYVHYAKNKAPSLNANIALVHTYISHCILLGVQVTTGLGFFLHSSYLVDNEDSDSLGA